jgi:uncharacterized protein YdeI (YjbR/CyaY-like superfamily)
MKEELSFSHRNEFRNWLGTRNPDSEGIWIVFTKNDKDSGFSAGEALEEALCFGWIDGLIKSIDEDRYKKYFSPRKKGSSWSEKNKAIIERLLKEKKITENGLLAIRRSKEDGSWDMEDQKHIDDEKYEIFETEIRKSETALSNYRNMPQSIKKQFVGLYNEPRKEETRKKKLDELIGLLENNIRPMDRYKKRPLVDKKSDTP